VNSDCLGPHLTNELRMLTPGAARSTLRAP
jgi:hypothetical protein